MGGIIKDIGDFIFVEDKPEKADAIMVAGGSFPEPAEIAADLFLRGLAPYVIIGGGVSVKLGAFPGPRTKREVYTGQYRTECDFYLDVLLKNGVPRRAILGEDRSSFTRENAVFARQIVDASGIALHKAMLVCKSFHARRCLMFYQSAFPQTQFLVIQFDGFGITKQNWFSTPYGVERVLGELRRCGDQFTPEDVGRFAEKL